jgi:hypothetical protein
MLATLKQNTDVKIFTHRDDGKSREAEKGVYYMDTPRGLTGCGGNLMERVRPSHPLSDHPPGSWAGLRRLNSLGT